MRRWSLKERLKQSQLIATWKPWKYATGPKTLMGKRAVRMNGLKHGGRATNARTMQKLLTKQHLSLQKYFPKNI